MQHTAVSPTQSVITTVTEAVATREDVDPVELVTPLYDAIDPESLERLLDADDGAARNSPIQVTFTYYGYDVTVRSDGTVTLRE
jgi:hypothetical protein